jgi:hypothetical protein
MNRSKAPAVRAPRPARTGEFVSDDFPVLHAAQFCRFRTPHGNDKLDIQQAQMTQATFTIAAIALVCGTGAAAPPVTFESPCECHDNHGKGRRSVKNDPSMLPPDVSAIHTVTPSDVFNPPGLNVPLTWESERTG